MPTKKLHVKKNTTEREDIFDKISAQLHKALQNLKEQLGEKKFEKRVKKAAKLLVEGIKETHTEKKAVSPKKIIPTKKKAVEIKPKD